METATLEHLEKASFTEVMEYIEQHYHKFARQQFPKLAKLSTIIEKVHGPHHPELTQVRELAATIIQEATSYHNLETELSASTNLDVKKDLIAKQDHLSKLFQEIRLVTKDFAIPEDVCETFVGTYQLLEETEHVLLEEMAAMETVFNKQQA